MVSLRRVVGNSMSPTLREGQLIVTVRAARIKPGDVVVIKHNDIEKIKRISQIKDNQIFVLGDNPQESSDSRNFGWLPVSCVMHKVLWHI